MVDLKEYYKTDKDIFLDEECLVKEDPLRLVEHGFLKIKTKAAELITLELNETQRIILDVIQDLQSKGKPVRLWVLKSRQQGVSTETEAIIYALTSQTENINSLILADEKEHANNLFEMSKLYHEELSKSDPHLAPRLKKSNEKKLEFDGLRSQIIIATAENTEAARSHTFHIVHLSECAFFSKFKEVMAGLNQSVPDLSNTIMVGETTGNGMNEFYDEWVRAIEGKTGWTPVFIPWFIMEEYKREGPMYPIDGINFSIDMTKEMFLEKEQALKAKFELTDAQISWRRYAIVDKCQGDIKLFNQEYPACVSGNTYVSSCQQGIVGIQDVSEGSEITKLYCNGLKDTVVIKTDSGRKIEITENHKVFTCSGQKEVKDIKVGDELVLQVPSFASTHKEIAWEVIPCVDAKMKITEDIGRFLGYFVGDGSLYCQQISFACYKDEDVIEDIMQLLSGLLGVVPSLRETNKKNGNSWEIRVSSKKGQELLTVLGVTERMPSNLSKVKRKVCVPSCIFQSPQSVVKEFLRGIFEADGFVSDKATRVSLFSKYEEFLRGIQLLLLGFGIPSKIIIEDKNAGDGHVYIGRSLILGSKASRLFGERIGFVSKRKRARTSKFAERKEYNGYPLKMTDAVRSIEYSCAQEVYDITYEPAHAYSANGIKVHNCWQDAFKVSGDNFFDKDGLDAQHAQNPLRIGDIVYMDGRYQFRDMADGKFRIYAEPEYGGQYVVAGDASEAIGKDEASLLVLDKRLNLTVAVANGHYPPDELGKMAVLLGNYYNQAIIAMENKGYGTHANQIIFNSYGNVYRRKRSNKGVIEETDEIGFNTNLSTRPEMLSRMAEEICIHNTELVDKILINQCYTFIINPKNKKAEGAEGKQDGLVICRAIAGQVRWEHPYSPDLDISIEDDTNYHRALEESHNGGFSFGN